MNMFQRINITASFLVMGALIAAFAQAASSIKGTIHEHLSGSENILLLALFIFLFKVKTMFDDHQHFGEPYQGRDGFRHVGFLLALFSWFFWGLAAYLVFQAEKAAELMIFSIGISTLWVVVHLVEIVVDKERRNSEMVISLMREKWVGINIGYILLLGVYLGWLSPLIAGGQYFSLVALLVLLAWDYLTSRSYPKNIG